MIEIYCKWEFDDRKLMGSWVENSMGVSCIERLVITKHNIKMPFPPSVAISISLYHRPKKKSFFFVHSANISTVEVSVNQ